MELIKKYFPDITPVQEMRLKRLESLYVEWNTQINVISRKDMEHFVERHVLHSLAMAKLVAFKPGTKVLDVGTGGGFPGIPLAILFPKTQFTLVDSIGKKIKVVQAVADELGLKNVKAIHARVENTQGQYQYIISRAVTRMSQFLELVRGKLKTSGDFDPHYGIWYLKGGDLKEELAEVKSYEVYQLSPHFMEDFFETKKLVHIPLSK